MAISETKPSMPGILAVAAAALIVFSAVSMSEGIYLVFVGSSAGFSVSPRPRSLVTGVSLLVLGGMKLFGGISLLYYSRMGAQMVLAAMASDFAVLLIMGVASMLFIHVFFTSLIVFLLARCWRYLV